jgi:hypothetical protein
LYPIRLKLKSENIEHFKIYTLEILFFPLLLLYSASAQPCQAQLSQLKLACDPDHPDFVTCDAGLPEGLDNVGVEDHHQDEGKDVEEDSLEDAVDETSVITPVRDTAGEVPEDVFNNARLNLNNGECGEDRSFWQADDGGKAPDDDQEEDNSALLIGESRERLADAWG